MAASTPSFKFALPPSLGKAEQEVRAPVLERYLSRALIRPVEVEIAPSYEALAKLLLSGKVDAAWAPPFVCARLEAMGVRVLARGQRNGASTYRSAIVCRANAKLSLDKLQGTTAAWVDRDSVAGYLLPLAFLRGRGLDPSKVFFAQQFTGSYRAALELVLQEKADITSIFAAPTGETTGVDGVLAGKAGEFRPLAFTDAVPNDGVAISMNAAPELSETLERILLTLHENDDGKEALAQGFGKIEKFEPAPRLGYRALYRVALASL